MATPPVPLIAKLPSGDMYGCLMDRIASKYGHGEVSETEVAPPAARANAPAVRGNAQRRARATGSKYKVVNENHLSQRQSACLADHGILLPPSPPSSPPQTPANSKRVLAVRGNADRARAQNGASKDTRESTRASSMEIYEKATLRQSACLADHGILIASPPPSPPDGSPRTDNFLDRLEAAEQRDSARLESLDDSARLESLDESRFTFMMMGRVQV